MLVFLLSTIEADSDRALFTEIYEQNHDIMEQVALRILKNSHDAEDALQNSFLQIIRNLHKVVNIPCKNRGFWCISIVKNESYMILRQKHRVVLKDELEESHLDDVEDMLSYQAIVQLFTKLPDTYRSVLEMKLLLGYSGKEIAGRLDITENAVNVRIARGKALLRKIAEKEGIHP